jgi:hypothetical protein
LDKDLQMIGLPGVTVDSSARAAWRLWNLLLRWLSGLRGCGFGGVLALSCALAFDLRSSRGLVCSTDPIYLTN